MNNRSDFSQINLNIYLFLILRVIVIFSHKVFDEVIFVFFPSQGLLRSTLQKD